MRTTVERLIRDAIIEGKNTTASNGRWKCRINSDVGAYVVTHHTTDMLIYYGPDSGREGEIFPVSEGYGSYSDKQGINAMLSNVYTPHPASYGSVYVEEVGTQGTSNPPIPYEEPPPKPDPDLEPFTPPLTVEDTMG